jgi:hypothetical protein
VNYQWAEIVLDQRLDSKKNANAGNKVDASYGNEDDPIQAGDRTPDAPNLVLVPVTAEGGAEPTATTTPFNLLTPLSHMALVFELPRRPAEPPSLASPRDSLHAHALRRYNKDGYRSSIRALFFLSIHLLWGLGEWLEM